MKALLVDIDMVVRVVVPDDATDEQITDLATAKAVDEVMNDHNTISENITGWRDDESVPFGEAPSDEPHPESKRPFIGFQIVPQNTLKGSKVHPDGLGPNDVMTSKSAVNWFMKNDPNFENWRMEARYKGDITDPVVVSW